MAFWLKWMYRLAQPLARAGTPPALVSASGAGLAVLGAAAAAAAIPGRLIWAALAITLAGLADGMDGAVAVLQRRDGPAGAIVDAVCDRITDLILVLTLWLAGAPGIVCCVIGAMFLLHEYIRALARSMGLRDDTIITVAERPTRVIVVIAFLLAGGTAGSWLGSAQAFWPAAGAWCALAVSMIGLVQLTVWSPAPYIQGLMDEGLGRNGRVTPGVSRREISWRPDSGRVLPRISPLPVWADALVLLALAAYLLIGLSGPALSREEAVQIGLTQDAGVLITHPGGLLPGAANSPAQDSARLAYGSLARYAAATGWYLVAGRDAPRPIDLAQLDQSSPSSPSNSSVSPSSAVLRPVAVHPIERSQLLAARALPALFAAISILMLFLVARRLLGRPAATVAVVVFALQPAVMDAGRTVCDAGLTLLFGLGAVYVAAGIGAALATGREATLSAWTAAGLWSGLCLAAGLDAFPLVAGAAGFCLAGLFAGQVARQRILMAGRVATGGTLGQNVASLLVTALVAVVTWVLVSPSLWGWLPDRLAARHDDRGWLIARGLLADPGPGAWTGRLQALPRLSQGPAGALLLYLVAAGGAVLLVLAARSVRAMNLSRRGAVALLIWAGVTLLWFVSWPSVQPAHTIPLLAVASLLAASLVSWAQNSRLVIRGTDQARDDRG